MNYVVIPDLSAGNLGKMSALIRRPSLVCARYSSRKFISPAHFLLDVLLYCGDGRMVGPKVPVCYICCRLISDFGLVVNFLQYQCELIFLILNLYRIRIVRIPSGCYYRHSDIHRRRYHSEETDKVRLLGCCVRMHHSLAYDCHQFCVLWPADRCPDEFGHPKCVHIITFIRDRVVDVLSHGS